MRLSSLGAARPQEGRPQRASVREPGSQALVRRGAVPGLMRVRGRKADRQAVTPRHSRAASSRSESDDSAAGPKTTRLFVSRPRGVARRDHCPQSLEALVRVLSGDAIPPSSTFNQGQRSCGMRGLSATIAIVLHCFLKTRVSPRRSGSVALLTSSFTLLFSIRRARTES